MAAREGFSFPSFHGSSSPITESPPLWCLSSSPKSIDHHGYGNIDCSEAEKRSYGGHRKVNSCNLDVRRARERVIDSDEEEDEKMDVLWEDFNEELLNNLSSRFGSGRVPELEYLKSEEPKALLSARMASVVVIMKVLKKLLFLHSFRRKPKARTW
ncbi:uncharacterized protein LOC111020194 [Momordica charantia]|uniref:Uncharacterized protein LOC111020194 n=1 Tax=Momordica charantia TaxID=3673 RepID=A0A6J1DEY5_MOMCH|nr:uncharacterized protein LOC111020194 [Momordica charantia]